MPRSLKTILPWVIGGLVLLVAAAPYVAQQVTGVPGSPSTTTISGKQLPPPDPKFGGVIKEKA